MRITMQVSPSNAFLPASLHHPTRSLFPFFNRETKKSPHPPSSPLPYTTSRSKIIKNTHHYTWLNPLFPRKKKNPLRYKIEMPPQRRQPILPPPPYPAPHPGAGHGVTTELYVWGGFSCPCLRVAPSAMKYVLDIVKQGPLFPSLVYVLPSCDLGDSI